MGISNDNVRTGPIRRRPEKAIVIAFCMFSVGFISTSFLQYTRKTSQSNHNRTPSHDDIVSFKYRTKNSKGNKAVDVQRIALLGERNSGTTWLYDELQKCFPMVNVTPALTRWKHWFQEDIDTEWTRYNNDTMTYRSKSEPTTLVIAEFRNVYDWIESMRNRPHNMPMHMNQDWLTFLTTAWTMPRPERDLELDVLQYFNSTTEIEDDKEDGHRRICQSDFEYHQVISCVKGTVPKKRSHHGHFRKHRRLRSEYEPIYEMRNDGSGLAYGSIIEMRRDKIIDHLSVIEWDWISDLVSVQYEKLLVKGTGWLLDEIQDLTGLEPQCEAVPPQPERLSHYPKDPGFEDWVGEKVDWQVENLIGYTRW